MVIYAMVVYEDMAWGDHWIQAYYLDKQKAEAALGYCISNNDPEYPCIYKLKEVEVIE